jgi:diguanylate cyclase (GGDEF)-like protein/PAS domain S-box-containing protein
MRPLLRIGRAAARPDPALIAPRPALAAGAPGPRPQEPGRAPHRRRRVLVDQVATTGLVLTLFAVAASLTLHLKHVGERGVRAERDLQSVATELHVQNTLEWRAISGQDPADLIRVELDESRARSEVLISQAAQESLLAADLERIAALQRKFAVAIDTELDIIAAGHPSEAVQFDASYVDPAFRAAQEALSGYADQVSAAADRSGRQGDIGILLTMAAALLLITMMQGRRRLAEVRREQERHGEARYRALVNQSADIVVVTDRAGSPRYLSPAAERLLRRLPGQELTATGFAELIHPDDRELLTTALASVNPERGAAMVEVRIATVTREPGWRHFEISVQDLFTDPAVQGIVLTGHDVTDRRALQREVEHRALHDNLTGLPNRALLADRLSQSLRIAQRHGTVAGLLLIDLDRFKEINDTLGHHYGDQLLAQVGPRLAEGLRKMDTVARLGGDEFAVLLPTVRDVHGATEVAHKLQAALARPFQVEGVQLDVEASIGVVISGAHGDDASVLMQRADIAMYVAKQRNLGVSTYDREIDSNTPERLALVGDLRRAVHDDELFLHFQPKIDLPSGRLCGAEALLRWQHPERGLIPPDDFIPLAENTGMIGPLTSHVLNLALAQIRVWADQGHPLQVAVNLSARNLLDERFDETVHAFLSRHGVAAELLKLEVTESALMTDPIRAAEVLRRLAAQGITLSIDDFGAGYTSIRQLKDLPISELKVDRSFVTELDSDSSNAVIVRSVIELGHNLGLSIVAEGVETVASLDRLSSYGCDVAQGYFISRPMSADAFEQWRDAWPGLPAEPDPPCSGSVSAVPAIIPGQRGGPAGRVPHP